jgi:PAS domain S-box-containing protein
MLPDFRVRQRDNLLEISRAITEELDLDAVLARITRVSAEMLAGHAGLIALRKQGGGWKIASTFGINEGFIKPLSRLLADIPDHGDPARFELPEVNRRLQRITQAASMGLLTGIGLPMIARHEVVGVIFVFRSYKGRFSSEDSTLLEGFATQAAIAVTNARLYSQVIEQKEHLNTIVESAADGIFILDPSLRFLRFNRACTRLTGYKPEDVLNKPHSEIIRWQRIENGPSLEDVEKGGWPLKAHATLYVEGDLIKPTGGNISVGITYAPALSSEGALLSIVATVRDITKFREADELKNTFISIISHELRTPVALIKGYVSTLRREDARWDPAVVNKSLKVIEEESDRLANLIDDLLDASRLQAGALELNLCEFALDELAKRLVERFTTQSEHHGFKAEFPPDFPLLYADEGRITQVISNLLSNAVNYAPEGGNVIVRGQVRPDEVIICVEDEGQGIARDDVPRIFDLFYRSEEVSQKTKGAGLGLYLARAVVTAHGGRIWVDEEMKKGARICFSLPRSEN